MQTVSSENMSELLVWLLLGIVICFFLIFIIRQTSQFISLKGGKIVYWRSVLPMLISNALIMFGRKWIYEMYDVHISYNLCLIIWIICMVYPLISWIFRLGIIKGICMYILQIIATVILVSLLYASAAFAVVAIVLVLCEGFVFDRYNVMIISMDTREITYVKKYTEGYWIDRDGEIYSELGNRTIIKQSNNEMFSIA